MTNKPVVFFGTPDFAARVLTGIIQSGILPVMVISMPDRPQGRGYQSFPTPVKLVAQAAGIPCSAPLNVDQLSLVLSTLPPFLGLVVAYGMILPEGMVQQYDLVNLHASLLPRYRGASPIQAALLNGDVYTGMSLMRIDKGVDAGDIIATREVPIEHHDQAETLMVKLTKASISLFVKKYQEGGLPWRGLPQDPSKATYTKKIKREDGLIDFSTDSAALIYRKWQAYTPWPGVFVFHKGKRVKLIEIELNHNQLVIQKVQCEGKSVSDYQSFVNGNGSLLTP